MYFKNLSGLKAASHSVVQIALIALVFVQSIEADIAIGFEPFTIPSTPTTKAAEIAAASNTFGFNHFNVQTTTTTKAPKVGSSFGFGLFNIPSALTNKAAAAVNSLSFGYFNPQTTPTTKAAKVGNSFGFGRFNTQSTTTTKTASTIFPTFGAFPTKTAFPTKETFTTKEASTTKEVFTTKQTTTTKAAFQTLTTKASGGGDYCSMCKSHVACKKKLTFGEACSDDAELVKMDKDEKETILKLHNKMRNKIAMGEMKQYGPAAKMPVFQWDDELQHLAEINARSCVFKHDTCRATKKFPYAGQNIARRYNNIEYEDKDIAIEEMITKWFSENKDADMSYIKSYHNQKKGKQIGHFTIMINDKNNAVGCASTKYYSNGNYYRYLVCNYGFTNVLTRPVYEDGATGSKCTKRHSVYAGLCSEEQVVIPVP